MDYNLIRRLKAVFRETVGREGALIDYVRFEVSVGEAYPCKYYVVDLPFRLGRHELSITEVEYQLAAKIAGRLCRDFGDELPLVAHDILKAVLDLRLLRHVDEAAVRRYVEQLGCTRGSLQRVRENLRAVLGFPEFYASHYYLLVRRESGLENLVEGIEAGIQRVLGALREPQRPV
ncbi:hypothetical protein IG193_00580 [Infirmifilum lucidum]|uniref:Uncharacterized protein n=1 Tax=Infirmifilum lucidum TaxID=2776706 RepID=A0A7L9FJC7_9CREN|nr:hypothetical protein [Infirmifilum lucidum]QOJ78996.1 hypothetical protein IG193_00580 [Infirmifilum lucidum]